MRLVAALLFCAASASPQTVTRLLDVHKIYVEKMDGNLDKYLRSEITRKFPNSLTVVRKRGDADAVLVQVKIDPEDTHDVTVNLTDSGGKAVLWSGTASDRDMMFLGLKHYGPEKVAQHLASQLKKAMAR